MIRPARAYQKEAFLRAKNADKFKFMSGSHRFELQKFTLADFTAYRMDKPKIARYPQYLVETEHADALYSKLTCPLPTCSRARSLSSRYPHALCTWHRHNTQNEAGEPIEFYNRGPGGGFMSTVDGRESDHKCFVEGVECYADEARFGGIVVSLADSSLMSHQHP